MLRARPLIAAGIAALVLAGPVQAQSRDFDLAGFDRIDIASGLDARVRLAEQFSVRAESRSGDALDNLRLNVEDGVLVARLEASFLDFILSGGLVGMLLNSGNAVTLDISLPTLTGATASAGADVRLRDMEGDTMRLDASSGAEISLQGARLLQLDASASSGADISISGNSETVSFNASSGADIDADDLTARRADLQASSGASIEVRVLDEVRARASSGGSIDIKGNPQGRDVETSSGGDVDFDD